MLGNSVENELVCHVAGQCGASIAVAVQFADCPQKVHIAAS